MLTKIREGERKHPRRKLLYLASHFHNAQKRAHYSYTSKAGLKLYVFEPKVSHNLQEKQMS